MQLYLVRHATPTISSGDPDLGEQGRREADQLATLFGRLGLPAGSAAVSASSAKRARQTAVPIAAAVGVTEGDIQTFPPDGIPLPPSPAAVLNALVNGLPSEGPPEHVILVGHFGVVNVLYGWLVGVPADSFPIAKATTAAVACDRPFAEKSGRLLWLVPPALLPGAGEA